MWLKLLLRILRKILALRYKIRVKGWDRLKRPREGKGILFLPNHPAEIDPVILSILLWERFSPSPLVIEDFYYLPGIHWIFRWIRALPVPLVEGRGGEWSARRWSALLEEVVKRLSRGEDILLYPSGQLMREQKENLRGSSAVYQILKRVPDVDICVIRTRGLLGSIFSWVRNHERPDFLACAWFGIQAVLKNGIFFLPKREVTIELEMNPKGFPRTEKKEEINRWLETWYNQEGPEPLTLVGYGWGIVPPPVWKQLTSTQEDLLVVPERVPMEIWEDVQTYFAQLCGKRREEIRSNLLLGKDLGLDSLNQAQLMGWLEERFGITDVPWESVQNVGDVAMVAAKIFPGEKTVTCFKPPADLPKWFSLPSKYKTLPSLEDMRNIPEAFWRITKERWKVPIVTDAKRIMSYGQLGMFVLMMAEWVKKETNYGYVGVLLPASPAADIAILGILTAGKIPVMLNWTAGRANVEYAMELTKIDLVISANAFLDRLIPLPFNPDLTRLGMLDELIPLWLTPKNLLRLSRICSVNWLLKCYHSRPVIRKDIAVVLFTSGSENRPKAVPLTHENILSNIEAASIKAGLRYDDCIFGFLPPFHSFGFTVTTLLPLIKGLRVCHWSNPLENRKLIELTRIWRPTCMATTPSFLKQFLSLANRNDLQSLRLVVTGAERTPPELFSLAREKGILIRQGYGITETAPVISLSDPDSPPTSVGRPLPGVEVLIVHPETGEECPPGEIGLILVCGPNVFPGYLGSVEKKEVFRMIGEKKYYVTGDLGYLDKEKNLYICGRMKRFVKIGGEMISLPALEDVLEKRLGGETPPPHFVVCTKGEEGERPTLVLFSINKVSLEGVNEVLKQAGFPNLARIHEIRNIESIPLLGSGKIDFHTLQKSL